MADQPKGYAVITAVQGGGTFPGVAVSAAVVNPDGTSAAYSPDTLFAYGDSDQKIKQAIVANIQAASGIADLDVTFIGP